MIPKILARLGGIGGFLSLLYTKAHESVLDLMGIVVPKGAPITSQAMVYSCKILCAIVIFGVVYLSIKWTLEFIHDIMMTERFMITSERMAQAHAQRSMGPVQQITPTRSDIPPYRPPQQMPPQV